ncbi:MAG: D-alanine--D-alanine ligase [Candidatus Omnitrophota bacterium]|nr:D-alanine--D-alanine ligase [Candidatus Omnitrophota bacterium]
MDNSDLGDIKVGVLAGGVSPERQVSKASAEEVFKSLERSGVRAVYIDIFTSDVKEVNKLINVSDIDFAFIALHGEFGEDGQIQKILEDLEIPYTGSGPRASSLALDKIASKEIFSRNGIFTAPYYLWEDLPQGVEYPLLIKPVYGGSSLGISVVRNRSQLKENINLSGFLHNEIFLEKYIEGREFTVGILENRALGVVEIIPIKEYFDFGAKYSDGLVKIETDFHLEKSVSKKIQEIGLAAHVALGCRHFSRVDFILDKKNNPVVLEVNSIPGLTSHSLLPVCARCRGMEFDDLILKIVRLGLHEKIQAKKI